QAVFGLLTVVFVGLGAGSLLQNGDVTVAAAAIGIVLGLVAMYTGLAEVINEVNRKEVLPLFPVSK
ncbi:MAG: GPR1/FUN34/YaaH family transporter, partial [Methanosarcina sp.]